MPKVVNQKFIQIPFAQLIQQVEYKAQEEGIRTIRVIEKKLPIR